MNGNMNKHKQQHAKRSFPLWIGNGRSSILTIGTMAILLFGYCYFLGREQRKILYFLSNIKSSPHNLHWSTSYSRHEPRIDIPNAINILRCFTTPNCYPRLNCISGSKPKKIPLSRKWEEHSFCIEDLSFGKEKHEKISVHSDPIKSDIDEETNIQIIDDGKNDGKKRRRKKNRKKHKLRHSQKSNETDVRASSRKLINKNEPNTTETSLMPTPTAATLKRLKSAKAPCLVYSFGINNSIEWESKMASLFQCEVYAFDPTSNFPPKPATNVSFYKLGLQGAGNAENEYVADVSATHSEQYQPLNSTLLRTLDEIVQMLGHEGRTIDVLKLDCEGCEYGVIHQLACGGSGSRTSYTRHSSSFQHIHQIHQINQLMIEFHFQKNLGLSNPNDVLLAGDAIQCLEQRQWGIVSLERSGCDPRDAQYIEPVYKVIKDLFFIMNVTLRRLRRKGEELYGGIGGNAGYNEGEEGGDGDRDRMSWELWREAADIRADLNAFEKENESKYGIDQDKWPEDVRGKWRMLDKEGIPVREIDSMYRDQLSGYDVYEWYSE